MVRKTALILMLFISGCGGCEPKKPLQDVEIKDDAKKAEVKIMHFDKDLFDADLLLDHSAVFSLKRQYGQFFCDFVERDLKLAPCLSDSLSKLLIPFVKNRDIFETHEEINRIFTDEKRQQFSESVAESLRRYKHFFPDSLIPVVIYYQSAWNTNIAASDSTLGISLDSYLGADNAIIKQLAPDVFPNYMKQNMDEKYLLADAVKGWVAYKSRHYYESKNLLSELVFYGKLMYVAEALAPEIPDSIMLSWSEEQFEWAVQHEWSVWKTIANEKVMFQTKGFEINKWFADGPFTGATGIPQDSPPQLGVWLGWNMVRDFMSKNPEISLEQLLMFKDDQKVLAAFTPQR